MPTDETPKLPDTHSNYGTLTATILPPNTNTNTNLSDPNFNSPNNPHLTLQIQHAHPGVVPDTVPVSPSGTSTKRRTRRKLESMLSRQDVINAIENDYRNLTWGEVIRQSKNASTSAAAKRNQAEVFEEDFRPIGAGTEERSRSLDEQRNAMGSSAKTKQESYGGAGNDHCLHNPNLLNDVQQDSDAASEYSDEEENRPPSKVSRYCAKAKALMISYRKKTLFMVITAIILTVAIFYEDKFGTKTWSGIPVWRLLFYFSAMFPAWIFSEIMLFLFLKSFGLLTYAGMFSDEEAVHDFVLFFRRYKYPVLRLLWSLWVTTAWGVFMSPTLISSISGGKHIAASENWFKYFELIFRLHFVLAVYFCACLLVHFICFKFLHKFSAKHLSTKLFGTIFQQIILLGLAGIRGSSSTLLVPDSLFKNGITEGVSQHRLEHAAARYVLSNDMEKIFSFQLGLPTDKSAVVKTELFNRIKANIRIQKQKMKLPGKNGEALEEPLTQSRRSALINLYKPKSDKNLSKAETAASLPRSTLQAVVPLETKASEFSTASDSLKLKRQRSASDVDLPVSNTEQVHLSVNEGSVKSTGRSRKSVLGTLNILKKKQPIQSGKSQSDNSSGGRRRPVLVPRQVLEALLYHAYGENLNYSEAFKLLDETNTDLITTESIDKLIEKAFDDRSNLIVTLGDSQEVTSQIKSWMQATMDGLVLFLGLIICKVNVVEAWLSISSFLLGFSFIFGQSIKVMFENVVFLYGSHPYDVGDMIRLGPEKGLYTVKRVLLQTTELVSLAGEVRTIQNSKICQLEPLYNLTQSHGYWQESFFAVDATVVTEEFIEKVEEDMRNFIKTRPDIYQGYFRIDYCDLQAPLKVKLMLGVFLRITWADPGACRTAQSKACIKFIESVVRHGGHKYTTYTIFNPGAGLVEQI